MKDYVIGFGLMLLIGLILLGLASANPDPPGQDSLSGGVLFAIPVLALIGYLIAKS